MKKLSVAISALIIFLLIYRLFFGAVPWVMPTIIILALVDVILLIVAKTSNTTKGKSEYASHNIEEKIKKAQKDAIKNTYKVMAISAVVCLVIGVLLYFITHRLILTVILSVVIVAVIGGGIIVIHSSLSEIKTAKGENKEAKKNKAIKKIVVSIAAMVVILIVGFVTVRNNIHTPTYCKGCGEDVALYSKYGYCYSCYKELEDTIRDGMNGK